ncbi:(2Fe-2S)-binding protein [Rhodobacter sp. NTK016B]|uniref:2Fe-2S iron-sulfur cluster-binding protein n=1 Tax=Rhodobacter sp. NTK016B TaxID=2759676 RepID=UPI001A90870E|nr:2Fe-2S iron-sulfur cluster-binding protein [Rhodobacter sp. NTK016B]MBN8291808.1 (2Fe-2S)-binding protein [Rhodobacter sp. NTK016B]
MTAYRLPQGGEIDRTQPLRFTYDGRQVQGYAGDSYASALLASGETVLGRSFKYRRPRGIFGAGVEEPNIHADIRLKGHVYPNQRVTTEVAQDGAELRACGAAPGARSDRTRFVDLFSRFIPSGFYYKTFMRPNWHLFEPSIRAMAGLGRVDSTQPDALQGEQRNHHCDAVVVGAGPVGIAAALMLAEAGQSVVLCDDGTRAGGSLLSRAAVIDGMEGAAWLAQALDRLAEAGVTLLTRTTAFGVYDHGLIALNQRREGQADLLWRIRPQRIVLAAGAIERPLPFDRNDLPGILSAQAGLTYLRRYALVPGKRLVIAANNDTGEEILRVLRSAGAEATLIDTRKGTTIRSARGRQQVQGVTLSSGESIACDALLVSGGFTPTIHLHAQSGGKLDWDAAKLAFVPRPGTSAVISVGGAAGHFTLAEAFAALPAALGVGHAPQAEPQTYRVAEAWPRPGMKGRVWIDYQHDVTVKDVELAKRENFVSVEHLKRYTTLGMATDQGKTSNLQGLALMGALTGRTIPEVGTTTYRPPFTPVPLASFAGARSGSRMNPVRRLALEPQHRTAGATLGEYGGWLRPVHYGADDSAIQSEAKRARQTVGVYDASPLGKIEVMGRDAAEFVDFVYYNTMSTLKPGRCRYGFMLSEGGIVHDDGVLVRLDGGRFIVSCSSSHVASVHAMLEEWRQDRYPDRQIWIHDATAETATVTVSGPKALAVLKGAGIEAGDLAHMATGWTAIDGHELRVTRVSFTGDRSYELSIRQDLAPILWDRVIAAAKDEGGGAMGIEALMILRAEKGFIVIGKDTDGMTRPMDLGSDAPLRRKKADFLGRRSLTLPEAQRDDRNQLVGLIPADGQGLLPVGAHGIETRAGVKHSIGYVTSSYPGAGVDQPVALGLIERGAQRHGEEITLHHLGETRRARLVSPCFLDPNGERLDA